jgi:hypothetical protein
MLKKIIIFFGFIRKPQIIFRIFAAETINSQLRTYKPIQL